MRIVIDLQSCQSDSRFRGIGRYSMSLAKAMARQAGNHETWLMLSDRFPDSIPVIRHEFEGLIPKDRIAVLTVNGPVVQCNPNNFWRARTAERIREYFLAGLQADIVHATSFFEGFGQNVVATIGALDQNTPTAVTLYDLIPVVTQGDYLSDPRYKEFYIQQLKLLKKANLVFAISDYTKQGAETELGIRRESIVNISAGIRPEFKPGKITQKDKTSLYGRYKLTKPFIMYAPGEFDDRKNIAGLVKAYSRLDPGLRKTYQLLVAGKYHHQAFDQVTKIAKEVGLEENDIILT
jgi:O-antigen biosynthesis alpha-1,2-mannosyltransferase